MEIITSFTYNQIPIEEFCKRYSSEVEIIPSRSLPRTDQRPQHLSYRMHNFILLGPRGIPMSSHGCVLADFLHYGDVEADIVQCFSDVQLSKIEYACEGEWLPLYGDWSEGFWHWMLENLPLAILAEESGFAGNYLIPAGGSFIRESLEMLGIASNRLIEHWGRSIFVEKLFLPTRIPAWGHSSKYLDLLSKTREVMLSAVSNVTPQLELDRVYISRNASAKSRRIVNEANLESLLGRYGFKPTYLEKYPLKEQIAIMSRVNAVVGPHGAGMVHLLFMPARALVLELFPPTYINPCMYATVKLLKHRYHMIPSYVNQDPYSYGEDILPFWAIIDSTLNVEFGDSAI